MDQKQSIYKKKKKKQSPHQDIDMKSAIDRVAYPKFEMIQGP